MIIDEDKLVNFLCKQIKQRNVNYSIPNEFFRITLDYRKINEFIEAFSIKNGASLENLLCNFAEKQITIDLSYLFQIHEDVFNFKNILQIAQQILSKENT